MPQLPPPLPALALPALALLVINLLSGCAAVPQSKPAEAEPAIERAAEPAVDPAATTADDDALPDYLDDPDFDAGPAEQVRDPWERFNRRTYAFNRGFDRIVFLPIARGYQRITPALLRRGVSNFFDNLMQPVTTLNLILQGRPGAAGSSFGRFAMNSTIGLGGLLDPAGHAGIPRLSADFGQTFSRWGWRDSRYLVLPVFGPSTARDTLGKVANSRLSPVSELARREGAEFSVLYGIDARARALSAEAMLSGSPDEYALVRDAYMQYRRCQVVDCSEELPDYLLPDYEFEIPDFEALRR